MIAQDNLQARDQWFAFLFQGHESVGIKNSLSFVLGSELAFATTRPKDDTSHEGLKSAKAAAYRLHGLRRRLPRFGV